MINTTYAIVDNRGTVYAHDITTLYAATVILEKAKKENQNSEKLEIEIIEM